MRARSKLDPAIVAVVRAGIEAGLSSEEIAEANEISPRRVRRYCEALMVVGLKPHQRQFSFRCKTRIARKLHRLAEESGDSPAKKIEQIIEVFFADGPEAARRKLGKLHRLSERSDG